MGAQEWIDFDARVRQTWENYPREPVWYACDRSGFFRERAVAQLAARHVHGRLAGARVALRRLGSAGA